MDGRLGFIGAGNMASAILHGAVNHGYLDAERIMVSDPNPSQIQRLAQQAPLVAVATDNRALVQACQVIVLAVKPQFLGDVLAEIREDVAEKALISIAAGWTVAMLEAALGGSGAHLLRVMPNTPAMVGAGMTALCAENTLSEEEFSFVRGMFEAVGRVSVVPERLLDAVVAISGSSPAYVYMLVEAMADAGVAEGLPRVTAYEMAAQAVLGAAKMVLETGSHPGVLKDAVCSPGGTTIQGVMSLEKDGFRSAVMTAMGKCAEKSRNMSKQ